MFDVIIIGAGVTGLGAAWHLTETLKKKVLLIEQFPFPHQFGSSSGHSRIIRQLYPEAFNCILMKEACNMWRDLEQKTEMKLFIQNGLINFGPLKDMSIYLNAIKSSGISAYEISSKIAEELFPNFNIPEEYCIIFDPIAGVLRADRCLKALMNRSTEYGLEFHEMEKVIDISVVSPMEVKISTNKGEYQAKSVIIATGMWSDQILKNLDFFAPLTPVKIFYALFKPNDGLDLSSFDYENLPSFMSSISGIYGMSGSEYPGCLKIGDNIEEKIDPDKRDSEEISSSSKEKFLNQVQSFLTKYIPKCSITPVNITTCVITNTPDCQPILDHHKDYRNVIIGCGFSGCGFKTGVIHGKLLAELATNQECSYDMKPYSNSRFKL